jgi:hypothetical protein
MKRFSHLAALTAVALAFATSMPVSALEKSDPDGCKGGGAASDQCAGSEGGGVGSSDPILEPSKMPPGGDAAGEAAAERAEKAAERKRKEAERKKEEERKKREAEAATAKSLGRVPSSSSATPGPQKSICEAARDARARNSPAAPNLEAQCRASEAHFETKSTMARPTATQAATVAR